MSLGDSIEAKIPYSNSPLPTALQNTAVFSCCNDNEGLADLIMVNKVTRIRPINQIANISMQIGNPCYCINTTTI